MNYQLADINGTKIHYEERGTGQAGIPIYAGINQTVLEFLTVETAEVSETAKVENDA